MHQVGFASGRLQSCPIALDGLNTEVMRQAWSATDPGRWSFGGINPDGWLTAASRRSLSGGRPWKRRAIPAFTETAP